MRNCYAGNVAEVASDEWRQRKSRTVHRYGRNGRLLRGLFAAGGVASLTEAAERSLRQWKFRSATLDARPVRASIVTAFTFTRPVVVPQQPPK